MFIVFPNQLYEDLTVIDNDPCSSIYIVEEPLFFHDPEHRPLRVNKVKIAYMVACMSFYHKYVLDYMKGKKQVHYIAYDNMNTFYKKVKSSKYVACYDPTDRDVFEKYTQLTQEQLKLYDSPNFLLNMTQLLEFRKEHPRQSKHAAFYKYVKRQLHVLEDEPSYDSENRSALPANYKQDNVNVPTYESKDTHSFYLQAQKYVQSHPLFSTFLGSVERVTMYPITFSASKNALQNFLTSRLHLFGTYQDAIHTDDAFLYHALMSPMINIGLLNPQYVLQEAIKMKGKIAMNQLEGFIRQVIGWREYMRYLYVFQYENLIAANHFQHNKTLRDWDRWFNGDTGMSPIDNEIKKAVEYGYSHHIIRLMMFLNFFILMEIHPRVIYTWFMEVVAIDAYDWVMKSNIYAMGWFYSAAMTKPYISTSNYIRKMSNYKPGEWCKIWDALFYRYLHTHKSQFTGSSKMYLQNLRYFEKKTPEEQKVILQTANSYITKATRPFKQS